MKYHCRCILLSLSTSSLSTCWVFLLLQSSSDPFSFRVWILPAPNQPLSSTWWRCLSHAKATSTPWWACASYYLQENTTFLSPSLSLKSGYAASAPSLSQTTSASLLSLLSSSVQKLLTFVASTKLSRPRWKLPLSSSLIGLSRRWLESLLTLSCSGHSGSEFEGIFRWPRFGPCPLLFSRHYIIIMFSHKLNHNFCHFT